MEVVVAQLAAAQLTASKRQVTTGSGSCWCDTTGSACDTAGCGIIDWQKAQKWIVRQAEALLVVAQLAVEVVAAAQLIAVQLVAA
jgi:hypothetical protein